MMTHSFFIDNVILEQSGVIFIAGWMNRVTAPFPVFDVAVGANLFSISEADLCFYRRPDTEQLLLEDHLQGFICIKCIDSYYGSNFFSVGINGQSGLFQRTLDIRSTANFIQSIASEYMRIVHHSSISIRLRAAHYCHQRLKGIWEKYTTDARGEIVLRLGSDKAIQTSIVTVLYGSAEYLRVQYPMLARSARSQGVELVIVANNLTFEDGIFDEISALYFIHQLPVTVVMLDRNAGFSRANNIGVAAAMGRRVVLMNPDVFPNDDSRSGLASFLSLSDGDLSNSIWSSLLLYGNGALMHAGMYVDGDIVAGKAFPTPLPVARIEHYGKGDIGRVFGSNLFFEVTAVSGALMFMQRKTFERMDGLSTDYIYAHYEDADFCLRAREQGIVSKVLNQDLFYHLEGVGKHETPIGIFTRDANRMFFSNTWQRATLTAIAQKTRVDHDLLSIQQFQDPTMV